MVEKTHTKKYWFKAKSYGYGWTPASLEGWVVVIVYVITTVSISLIIGQVYGYALVPLLIFLSIMAILTIILLFISYKTGEKPYWRWGTKSKNSHKK